MRVWISRATDLETYDVKGKTLREILLDVFCQRLKVNLDPSLLEIKGYQENSRECISLTLECLDQPLPPDLTAVDIKMNCRFEEAALWLLKHHPEK